MTATTGTILALDFGKFKSVACVYDRDHPDRPRFESVTSNRQHLARLIAKYAPAAIKAGHCPRRARTVKERSGVCRQGRRRSTNQTSQVVLDFFASGAARLSLRPR
jgi:hypothetical protein